MGRHDDAGRAGLEAAEARGVEAVAQLKVGERRVEVEVQPLRRDDAAAGDETELAPPSAFTLPGLLRQRAGGTATPSSSVALNDATASDHAAALQLPSSAQSLVPGSGPPCGVPKSKQLTSPSCSDGKLFHSRHGAQSSSPSAASVA